MQSLTRSEIIPKLPLKNSWEKMKTASRHPSPAKAVRASGGGKFSNHKRPLRGDGKRNVVDQQEFFKRFQPPKPRNKHPAEWRVVALRECPLPESMKLCETPQHAAD